jgi:hypothetical protein
MKRKGLVVVLLCVLGLATISIGNVEAAPPWYTVTVTQVGASWTDSIINVTDTAATPAFTNTSFILDNSTGRANQMLATALTAFANSTYLVIYLDNITQWSSTPMVFATK